MITASMISITNEVISEGDDNIPSHWPTFEEVGGVRWDWDELSILSDSDDEDATVLPTSSQRQRTRTRSQHASTQRRRRQNKAMTELYLLHSCNLQYHFLHQILPS